MVLEHDFKICYSQREKSNSDLKLSTEKLNLQNDEINFLKERIKVFEKQSSNSNESQFEMFQKEIEIILTKLLEKTNEFFNFEKYHRNKQQQNK